MRWRMNSLYWAADTKSFRNATIYHSVVAAYPLCVPDLMTEQILADTTWTYFLSLVLSCQKIASIKCRWLYNTFDNYPVLRSPRKMSTTWCFCKCEWGSYGYVVDSIDDNIKWRVMLRSWFLCQTKVLASLSVNEVYSSFLKKRLFSAWRVIFLVTLLANKRVKDCTHSIMIQGT